MNQIILKAKYFSPVLPELSEHHYYAAVFRLFMMALVIYCLASEVSTVLAIVCLGLIALEHISRVSSYLHTKQFEILSSQISEKKRLVDYLKQSYWWQNPLFSTPWLFLLFLLFSIAILAESTQFDTQEVIRGWPMTREFLVGLLSPDWTLLHDAIFIYARQTLEVGLLGTFLGLMMSIPLSVLCAKNIAQLHPVLKYFYGISRVAMVIVRAVPTFLWGLIFVALVGLGPFPGVLAITLFSMGVMVKLFSETIESIDMGVLDAIEICGGAWVNKIVFGVYPQIRTNIIAQLLYCFEINIHSATVLGLIGAEGIGLPIHEYLSAFAFSSASTFILITLLMTIIIDFISAKIRAKLRQ